MGCPTPHKMRHRTQEHAEIEVRKMSQEHWPDMFKSYLCACGSWHIRNRTAQQRARRLRKQLFTKEAT